MPCLARRGCGYQGEYTVASWNGSTLTTLNFIRRKGRLEKLVAEVEIVFGPNGGILSGMKLVGLCIWKSDEGGLFVTLPARVGKGGRYFDYLRPAMPGNRTTEAFKEEVLRQWGASQAAGASDG